MKIRRLGAIIGALALAFSVAGVASANSPQVASVDTPVINGLDVTISFTPAWDSVCPNDGKYIGAAVSWGDGASANTITVGTQILDFGATNHVSSPLDPPGAATNCVAAPLATWTVSHTYAGEGTFDICPVVYDLTDDAVPGDGNHGDTAGGPDRNQDNSVEDPNPDVEAQCVSVEVAPATSTDAAPASNDNGTLPLILLIVGLVAAVAVIRPLSRRSR